MPEDIVTRHITRGDALKSERGVFETQWQEIAERIFPENANFTYTASMGEKRMTRIFDSTPIHANMLLSSGLFSLLTSSANQWFQLSTADLMRMAEKEIAMYLDEVSKILYHEIQRPEAGFTTAIHEGYLDYGAFGNLIMFVSESIRSNSLLFTSLPLNECMFVENEENRVDTLYRIYNRSCKQLYDKFGMEALAPQVQDLLDKGKMDRKIDCYHIIMPRKDFDFTAPINTRMPFGSIYIDKKHKHVIAESGFHELPFMAARFYKASHEVYGRGPGNTTLPDVKMLMDVAKTTIRAAQKSIDPPLMAPDQGFLNPPRTTPGGINFYRRGTTDRIEPIQFGSNPGMGIEYSQSLHERIKDHFFIDQMQLHQGPQMTATEVLQRTEEKLRLMGPLLGRIQTELLGPMIQRCYNLLKRAGKLPPVPVSLEGEPLKIIYTSPIARAQEQIEANGIVRMLQVIEPLLDRSPQTVDVIDSDEIARGVGDMFSVSRKYFKDQTEVDAKRAADAKAIKDAQEAENLAKVGKGLPGVMQAGKDMGEAGIDPAELQRVISE